MEIELRPLEQAHAAELRRIRDHPEVQRWWDATEDDFPMHDEPTSVRFTIFADGAVAGMVQHWEETEPKYRYASIDIFVDPAVRGRGVGPEALRQVIRMLFDEHDHRRLVIDPALDNAAAIRAYEKVGFRRVGVLRQAERDADGGGWHDALMMDMLKGEER